LVYEFRIQQFDLVKPVGTNATKKSIYRSDEQCPTSFALHQRVDHFRDYVKKKLSCATKGNFVFTRLGFLLLVFAPWKFGWITSGNTSFNRKFFLKEIQELQNSIECELVLNFCMMKVVVSVAAIGILPASVHTSRGGPAG
jgi:hypothetical protein